MKRPLFVLSLLGLSCTSIMAAPTAPATLNYAAPCEAVQAQSQALKTLQQNIQQSPLQKNQLIEAFWQQAKTKGTPLIETVDQNQSRIIFLYRGAQHNVRLVGGPSNDHEWLTRLPGTDIWFKESLVNNTFIGSYSFAVDLPNLDGYLSHACPHLNPQLTESRTQRRAVLQVLQLDPFNLNTWFKPTQQRAGLRNENIVALPHAPEFIDPQKYPDFATPQLKSYSLNSTVLGNTRQLQIYQSSNPAQKPYITAIFFDGEQYAHLVNVPKTLEILVQQEKLPPIQVVFVSPASEQERPKELSPSPEFSRFFSTELLPWIDQKLQRDPQKTVLLGSSLGGLSAGYLALQNPEQISHAVPLSGSFWWTPKAEDQVNGMSQLIQQLKNQPRQHFYMSAGNYESSRNNNGLSILETSPIVAQDLKTQGHDVTYRQYHGAHSYAIWQVVLQDALLHFFGQ